MKEISSHSTERGNLVYYRVPCYLTWGNYYLVQDLGFGIILGK